MVTSEVRSWTTPGAKDAAAATYRSVRTALEQSPRLASMNYEVFLQGSYANATNTRGDSDVDIVVMLTSTYMPDITRLPYSDRQYYEADRIPGTISADELRGAVQAALFAYYGSDRVHPKNKCIRVDKRDGYVDADVVPALQERLFTSYTAPRSTFVEGISIQPLNGSRITNYPKEHIKNGVAKNALCNDRYKPTVRQIKRLRRRAVDLRLLSKTDAPGYLLECLIYNAPTSQFILDDYSRVVLVLQWLSNMTVSELASTCYSCDGIHKLFVTDPGNHNEYTAKRVLDVLWDLV